jgi:hypothetical protein
MLWRFARDTPGMATQLGLCWSCHAALADTSAEHCPGCGADVNGPVDWAVEPEESPDEAGSPEAAEELVLLEGTPGGSLPSPPGAAPRRGGGTPLSAPGRPLALMIVLVGAAVCVGTFWSVFEIVRGQQDRAEPADAVVPSEPASPRRQGVGAPGSPAEAPAGALPGELFPRVPFESPTTRPGPPEVTTAPADADGLSPEQLTAQRRRGRTLLAEARRLHAAGDLLGAQALLLELLNRLDARAWPEGAEQELRRIQAALAAAATSAPAFFDTERK